MLCLVFVFAYFEKVEQNDGDVIMCLMLPEVVEDFFVQLAHE